MPGIFEITYQGQSKTANNVWVTTLKVKAQIQLSKLFFELAGLVEQRIIDSFFATRTTLEQVFISFARFQHDFAAVAAKGNGLGGIAVNQSVEVALP